MVNVPLHAQVDCHSCTVQEMRRPAPQERPAKRQRSSPAEQGEGDAEEQEAFQELGRFDYAAADSLASGAQGFLLTCGFRRHAMAHSCPQGLYSCLTPCLHVRRWCHARGTRKSPPCVLDREKSATREAVGVLSEVIGGLWEEGDAPRFSIMKLPVRGVVLLLWHRSPEQPRPVAVVAEVIASIHARKRNRLKSVALAR